MFKFHKTIYSYSAISIRIISGGIKLDFHEMRHGGVVGGELRMIILSFKVVRYNALEQVMPLSIILPKH